MWHIYINHNEIQPLHSVELSFLHALHASQHDIHAQEYDGKQDIYDIFKCKILTLNKMFKDTL